MINKKEDYIWGILRICLGLIFLWAFFDKLFGLGFATTADKSWLLGNSPTSGFLEFGTKGIFAGFYQSLAGSVIVDWLFMVGLLFIGVALTLGIGVKLAGYSGVLLLLMMYTAGFMPPEHHPFLDEHIIYSIVLIGCAIVGAGRYLGFGNWWSELDFVRRNKWLE